MKPQSSLCQFLAVLFTVLEVASALLIPLSFLIMFLVLRPALLHQPKSSILSPVGVEIDARTFRTTSATITAEKIQFEHLQGTLRLLQPRDHGELNKATKTPMALMIFLLGVCTGAMSDLFRRMFRNVGRGEVFTAINVCYIRWIGGLIIASAVSLQLLSWWEEAVTLSFVRDNLSVEGISFLPVHSHGWFLILHSTVLGLIVLALAEVFNQGIALKQDNDLTI